MRYLWYALILGCLSTTLHALTQKEEAVLQQLWHGILESRPSLVRKAIAQGAMLTTRGGQYEDTPLIAALRIYGNSLISQIKRPRYKDITKRIAISGMSSFIIAVAAYYFTKKDRSASIISWFSSLSILLPVFLWIPRFQFGTPAEAKVIEIILNTQTTDLESRNREGLNALEVLSSYYPYAYELQDPLWYQIISYLIQNSSDTILHYNVIDDINTELQKLNNNA